MLVSVFFADTLLLLFFLLQRGNLFITARQPFYFLLPFYYIFLLQRGKSDRPLDSGWPSDHFKVAKNEPIKFKSYTNKNSALTS